MAKLQAKVQRACDKVHEMIEVIIETPRGCRNKFKFDPRRNRFLPGERLCRPGSAFPYDFGFIPGTVSDDGDPLDVLLLMDEPAFPGCVVWCSGSSESWKPSNPTTEETLRNDRIIAVRLHDAHDYGQLKTLKDVNPNLLKELEHFFISYNETRGKRFKLLNARCRNRHYVGFEESRCRRSKKSSGSGPKKNSRATSRRHAK